MSTQTLFKVISKIRYVYITENIIRKIWLSLTMENMTINK